MRLTTAIVWLRRDLRLSDNPALSNALESSDKVLMVYIHAPDEEAPWQPGAASDWWLHHSLVAFARSLHGTSAKLVIRRGDSLQTLRSLAAETGAGSVFWNRLYDPAIVARDRKIRKTLNDEGIEVHSHNGALLREPWEATKDDGSMYRVYTPFSRRYFEMESLPETLDAPEQIPSRHLDVETLEVDDLKLLPAVDWDAGFHDHWTPGETAGQQRLQTFLEDAVAHYDEGRNIPAEDGVSLLSPHLHFGELSPRQVWHETVFHGQRMENEGRHRADAVELVKPYLRQLIWRDFAHHILFHQPETDRQPFNDKFSSFEWDHDQALLERWQQGKTGIPLVDAGMRQLWHTGWMHNRVRMLVASVLTKNALNHWLDGAKWFWDTLVDANLANNSMGWQWTAGCGVDAAPYFRIFSPTRQGERFDQHGEYVKQWVPELASLPAKYIHEPWKAPDSVLEKARIRLGEDYPEPMLDLSATRKEALARFKRLR